MKLYRVTYSGEAYVLADSADEAETVIGKQIRDQVGLGIELDSEGPIECREAVTDVGWLGSRPYCSPKAPRALRTKTLLEILESK